MTPPFTDTPECEAAFYRNILAASDDCVKILSLDGRLLFMSEGGRRIMEVDDFDAIAGCPWPDFWQGQANIEARLAVDKAAKGFNARFQAQTATMRGNMRWWDVKVSPILDESGKPASILSISRDITAMKSAETSSRNVSVEMGHRLRNILSLVQAIVAQTLRGNVDDALLGKLNDRIQSLSRAHDILLSESLGSGWMMDVVKAVAPLEDMGDRFIIDGPNIRLGAPAIVTLSMLLHELSTNATKHGSLSNADGRVALTWKIDSATADAKFVLEWVESGGPPVEPPTSTGLGSKLLRAGLPGSGDSEVRYEPDGFRALFRALMEDMQPRG